MRTEAGQNEHLHFCPVSSKISRPTKGPSLMARDIKSVYVVLDRETGEATFGTGSLFDLCLIRDNADKAIRALWAQTTKGAAHEGTQGV